MANENLQKLEKDIRQKLPRLSIKVDMVIGSGIFSVLPHIMLNDVLEWLSTIGEFSDEFCIESSGELRKFDNFDYTWYSKSKWDLSKPHLKDQSQELIDYLVSLI